MKKTKLTRSLLAACSIVALTAVMYGCTHDGDDPPATDDTSMDMPDPAIGERAAIGRAINAAETAVAGIDDDSTDTEVNAANMAVTAARTAISDAENLPETETAANTRTVNAIANRLSNALESRKDAMDDADDQMRKDMAATGKALRAALGGPAAGGNALANIDTGTTPVSLTAAGLVINAASGAGSLADGTGGTTAVDPAPVTLKAGDSAGALGSWMGTNYALTTGTGDSKLTNEAVVYTNQGSPTSMSFVEKYGDANEYTAATRTYNVGDAADANIKAAAFPTAGTKTFAEDQDLPGTYDGAPGRYKCEAATASTCTAAFTAAGIIDLSDAWTFVHDSGARVSTPDAEYLYYGWWVSKDNDGMPTAASAFAGVVEPTTGDLDNGGDLTALTGSATYVGNAAGKFAMSNPLDGTGNGGHFTADAELEATFSGDETGVTGTIDNFRLNDGTDDPGWSVALARGALGSSNGTITAPSNDPTVWSINGNEAPASGTWSGTMYDEMPGNAPDGDGSNIPTTVTGTFYSEFSSIGRMVGAFGADKQ